MTSSHKITAQEDILIHAHHDFEAQLNAYALSKTHNPVASGDLVQDTFIKTWSHLAKGGQIYMMKTFLYYTLKHLIHEEAKKKQIGSLDTLIEHGFEITNSNADVVTNETKIKTTLRLISQLPKKYNKLIQMRYIQGLTLKEMSLLTGESTSTLAVQTHRGRQKLRNLYTQSLIKQKTIL